MTEHDAGSVRRPLGRWIGVKDEFRKISVRFTSADTQTSECGNGEYTYKTQEQKERHS